MMNQRLSLGAARFSAFDQHSCERLRLLANGDVPFPGHVTAPWYTAQLLGSHRRPLAHPSAVARRAGVFESCLMPVVLWSPADKIGHCRPVVTSGRLLPRYTVQERCGTVEIQWRITLLLAVVWKSSCLWGG